MSDLPYLPAGDPLGRSAPLEYPAEFPFQGIPLEVQTNSAHVLRLAEECFGAWRRLPRELVTERPPIPITVIVHPFEGHDTPDAPFTYRVFGDIALAVSGGSMFAVHHRSPEATAFVTPGRLENGHRFRQLVLQPVALQAVLPLDRSPTQAAAICRNGRALLLLGRSGAGKSTLCYAALSRGFRLISEDAVSVSTEPGPRLWSSVRSIRLCPDAVRFFPELAELPVREQDNGKLKMALDEAMIGDDQTCLTSADIIVCVLQRHRGEESRLEPAEPDALYPALTDDLEPGFDLSRKIDEVAKSLLSRPRYRLVVGTDPVRAVETLTQLTG